MSYELALLPEAEREWNGLDGSVKQIFKKQSTVTIDSRVRISYEYHFPIKRYSPPV